MHQVIRRYKHALKYWIMSLLKNTVLLATMCVLFLGIFYWISPEKNKNSEVRTQEVKAKISWPRHLRARVTRPKPVYFKEVTINGERKILFSWVCPKIKGPPNIKRKDSELQHFPQRDVYLYSAYLDLRQQKYRRVKILGFSVRNPKNVYCQMFYEDGVVYTGLGLARDMKLAKAEKHKKFHYIPMMFTCDEKRNATPVSVTLTDERCTVNVTNSVTLQEIPNKKESKIPNKILICVKTLYNYQSHYRLIEFLEYQKLMGADHVVVYDYEDAGSDVIKVINNYKQDGYVSIQKWKLKMKTHRRYHPGAKIKTHGQITQINDCIYRYMNKYKYIVMIDPDEFITPYNSTIQTYRGLISILNTTKTHFLSHVSHFSFSHVHFCLTPMQVHSQKPELLLVEKTRRDLPLKHGDRSKCMVNPRKISQMGVHKVVEHLPGSGRSVNVPPEVALLHHYRKYRMSECNVTDNASLRYGKSLTDRVNQVCKKVGFEPLKY